MIGQTITIDQRISGKHMKATRKIVAEHYEYGRRIYDMIDPSTGGEHTAVADDIDRLFKPPARSKILPKGTKGPNILPKQAR